MNQLFNMLILEDSEDDAMLLIRHFKKAGFQFTYQVVSNAELLEKSLRDQNWDIVISDYNLPQFNGLLALDLVKRIQPQLPFILVSGQVGEEIAVKVMKAGADDYIMKDNMQRLAPAVSRAIANAKVKKDHQAAQQNIRENEVRLRALFNSSQQNIYLLDKEGQIIWLNRVAKYTTTQLFGIEATIGNHMHDFVSPKNLSTFQESLQKTLKGQQVEFDQEYEFPNGEKRWFNVQFLPVEYHREETSNVCLSMLDITQKKIDELELKLKNEKLEEYIFITSHEVRRPVANIIGLVSLLDMSDIDDPENREIIENLKASAQQLDEVIHKTNSILKS